MNYTMSECTKTRLLLSKMLVMGFIFTYKNKKCDQKWIILYDFPQKKKIHFLSKEKIIRYAK